jgi:hypothetical protein
MTGQTDRLRRYCDLPSLLQLLSNKQITLLDPNSWEDKNDSYYLQKYKESKGLKTLLALCLTKSDETFHHWKVFSGGSGGACIVFKRVKLLERLNEYIGITMGNVNYLTMGMMRSIVRGNSADIDEYPFIKRLAYEDEKEYRILYENQLEFWSSRDFLISMDMIESIRLSPWLHPDLSNTIKTLIHGIKGCASLRVSRSTLLSNDQWKEFAETHSKSPK